MRGPPRKTAATMGVVDGGMLNKKYSNFYNSEIKPTKPKSLAAIVVARRYGVSLPLADVICQHSGLGIKQPVVWRFGFEVIIHPGIPI